MHLKCISRRRICLWGARSTVVLQHTAYVHTTTVLWYNILWDEQRIATNMLLEQKIYWANNTHRDSSCTTQDIASPSIGQLVEIADSTEVEKTQERVVKKQLVRTAHRLIQQCQITAVSGKLFDTQLWRHTCARKKRNNGSLQHWRWQKC